MLCECIYIDSILPISDVDSVACLQPMKMSCPAGIALTRFQGNLGISMRSEDKWNSRKPCRWGRDKDDNENAFSGGCRRKYNLTTHESKIHFPGMRWERSRSWPKRMISPENIATGSSAPGKSDCQQPCNRSWSGRPGKAGRKQQVRESPPTPVVLPATFHSGWRNSRDTSHPAATFPFLEACSFRRCFRFNREQRQPLRDRISSSSFRLHHLVSLHTYMTSQTSPDSPCPTSRTRRLFLCGVNAWKKFIV